MHLHDGYGHCMSNHPRLADSASLVGTRKLMACADWSTLALAKVDQSAQAISRWQTSSWDPTSEGLLSSSPPVSLAATTNY